jgi:hypothetical protein
VAVAAIDREGADAALVLVQSDVCDEPVVSDVDGFWEAGLGERVRALRIEESGTC